MVLVPCGRHAIALMHTMASSRKEAISAMIGQTDLLWIRLKTSLGRKMTWRYYTTSSHPQAHAHVQQTTKTRISRDICPFALAHLRVYLQNEYYAWFCQKQNSVSATSALLTTWLVFVLSWKYIFEHGISNKLAWSRGLKYILFKWIYSHQLICILDIAMEGGRSSHQKYHFTGSHQVVRLCAKSGNCY